MYEQNPTEAFKTDIIQPVKVAMVQRISRQLAASTSVDVIAELVTDTYMVKLQSLVYEDPRKHTIKDYVVEEELAHPTWKHALIASLPVEAQFRRRFLGFFWDISPMYETTIKTHTVRLEGRALFPDMNRVYPNEFGPVQYVTQMSTASYINDPGPSQ